MMNKALAVLVILAAITFVATGLRWIVDPSAAAGQLGMPLLEGVGRSSQVGDIAAFFLTLGMCMLTALVAAKRQWYYPPIMLLVLAAAGRLLAWLVHDATLALHLIAPEIIIACLLILASRRLSETA